MDEQPSNNSAQPNEYVYPRAHRLLRGLTWLYASAALAVGLWLTFGLFPTGALPAMAREWFVSGLAAIVLPALLVALTGSVAALAMTGSRFQYTAALEGAQTETPWDRRVAAFFGANAPTTAYFRSIKGNPGFAARQGQAIIVTTGAVLVWIAERSLWPPQASPAAEVGVNVGAAFTVVCALAFASLMAERLVHAFPELQWPEAPTVRRLLLFTTLALVAGACLEVVHGLGVTWVRWPVLAVALLPGAIMLELTLRALARLFLPPPLPSDATAVTDSLLAGVITGGPRAPAVLLRTHLGLDFSRSWAVAFLSAALLPALLGTGLLCWGLSGVKLIDLGQRGIYERFGAPVAVLGPGLHLLLPWPVGRLRPVEYGEIHSVAIGVDQGEPDESVAVGAEAAAPLALNRLWESKHPGQAYYLVPSTGTGPQGFQSIATEIRVLYRVGLNDTAALQSVYSVADPESLIRDEAGSQVLRFFSSRTLETVIGARRENVAGALRAQLTADIDSHHAGIEIVSVLIEEIHPPEGAAAAYHAVQAAQINATASIFDEQARAELTAGGAQQQAYQLTTAADAKAAEIHDAADAAAYRFNADRGAFAAGGKAFLLERFYGNLGSALSKTPVTIVDHRLNSAEGPVLDLRATAASIGSSKPAAPPPLIPGVEYGRH
jgi:regulator of protease activity HflC (stomatin/prohibitin superfamily)